MQYATEEKSTVTEKTQYCMYHYSPHPLEVFSSYLRQLSVKDSG